MRPTSALAVVAASLTMVLAGAAVGAAAEFPLKGKPITIIVPVAAGGATDISTRMVADLMKRELATPVQVVNKPGAGTQTGITELALAKPDGYTLAATPLPGLITTYLDPDRKAVYTGKSFQPLANVIFPPVVVSVRADSKFKTIHELLAAAKAQPGTIKIASAGIMSNNHLTILRLQKLGGAQFAIVQFQGGSPSMTAMLGGHVDATVNVLPEVLSHVKSGTIRALGITDKQESRFLPGVKPLTAQGLKVYAYGSCGMAVPSGTPRAIVDVLSTAVKKAMEDETFKKKMEDMGYPLQYMDAEQYERFWAETEADVAPLVKDAKQGGL